MDNELREETAVTAITAVDGGYLEVRSVTRIMRGDAVVAQLQPHRHVVSPGDDLAGEDAKVASIAAALWTPEIIAAHRERMAEAV